MKKMLFLFIVSFALMAFSIPDKLHKRVDKTIASYFDTDEFSKEVMSFSENTYKSLPANFKERLFKIKSKNEFLGYVYIGNAPSKTATFDYMILFDKEFIIMKSKVLVYREEYGGEIGSKRWLKQFIGESFKSEELVPTQNISAISGATISVRSMTNAVNDVLQSIKQLKKSNAL